VDDTIAYIENQTEHHKRMSFKEELQIILKKHGIEYEERDARLSALSPLAGLFGFSGLSTHC
jgi:hypothetical protein